MINLNLGELKEKLKECENQLVLDTKVFLHADFILKDTGAGRLAAVEAYKNMAFCIELEKKIKGRIYFEAKKLKVKAKRTI